MSTLRSESGASLVEVAMSLAIFSIALIGIAAAFPLSRTAVSAGNQVGVALSLARQTLEDMRNRRYTTTIDEITPATYPGQAYGTIPNFPGFRRTVSIADSVPEAACTPPPGTPCTKTVTVTVFYRDHTGQELGVPLTTIFVR